MGGSFQGSAVKGKKDKIVALGGRNSKSVLFCPLLWFKIRGRDLRIFIISQGKSREGRKEKGEQ